MKNNKYPHWLMTKESREKNKLALIGRKCWKKGKEDKHHAQIMRERWIEGRWISPSINATKEKSWNWKGDKVGYAGIHKWVNKWKGRPIECGKCGRVGGRLEWANIDHKYCRALDDYISMCHRCHDEYDKKFNNKYNKKTKL